MLYMRRAYSVRMHMFVRIMYTFVQYMYWYVRLTGYYLATAAEDSVVKLWDLRKLKNFRSIALEERYEIKSLSFDYSGAYLAVAGTDVRFAF